MPTIQGKSNWARVSRPDNYDNYSITVDVPEEFIQMLKANKVKSQVKAIDPGKEQEIHDPDMKFSFNFRRKADKGQPNLIDAVMNPVPSNVLIGNGSDVIVQYHMYSWDDSGTDRMKIELDGVQVLSLIPYVPQEKNEFTTQKGYTADESGIV